MLRCSCYIASPFGSSFRTSSLHCSFNSPFQHALYTSVASIPSIDFTPGVRFVIEVHTALTFHSFIICLFISLSSMFVNSFNAFSSSGTSFIHEHATAILAANYCYNIVNEIHEITPFNQIRLNWSVSLN